MVAVTVVFILAFVVLAMAVSQITGIISGNETDIGLPAGFDGITNLLGVLIAVVAGGILIAPLASVLQSVRRKSGRRERY